VAAIQHVQLVNLDRIPDPVLFGCVVAMQDVRRKIEKIADSNVPVLIRGESGTGKEVFAIAIHSHSCWKNGPFVKIKCAALPGSLTQDELMKAFAEASSSEAECVGSDQGTTLLFDEVSDLHPHLQTKLLQVLQEGQFSRTGPQGAKNVKVHVICTTNRDLEAEVEAERFRVDLLYRIHGFVIDLLPLRQRAGDIPEIADYLLRSFGVKHNTAIRTLSPQLIELMQRYQWPGNIRELENLIRRYVILGSEQVIGSELLTKLSADFQPGEAADGNISLKKLTRQAAFELERRVILKALENNGWNRKRAARSLNISYRALLYKIKQGGMPPKRSCSSRVPAQASSDGSAVGGSRMVRKKNGTC